MKIYIVDHFKVSMLDKFPTILNFRKIKKTDFARILRTRKVIKENPKKIKVGDLIMTKNNIVIKVLE